MSGEELGEVVVVADDVGVEGLLEVRPDVVGGAFAPRDEGGDEHRDLVDDVIVAAAVMEEVGVTEISEEEGLPRSMTV